MLGAATSTNHPRWAPWGRPVPQSNSKRGHLDTVGPPGAPVQRGPPDRRNCLEKDAPVYVYACQHPAEHPESNGRPSCIESYSWNWVLLARPDCSVLRRDISFPNPVWTNAMLRRARLSECSRQQTGLRPSSHIAPPQLEAGASRATPSPPPLPRVGAGVFGQGAGHGP